MLRKLLVALLAAVVGTTAYYYYETRQINKALDEVAQHLAPMGRFEHGGATVSLGGEVRVNQLRFRPHGSEEDFRVERTAIKTGSLLKLMQVDRHLREGRLPSQLGFALRGLRFPLDGPFFEELGESGNPGLAFDAAGCDGRDHFSGRDLARMGYLDFTGSMDIDYHLIGDVEAVSLSLEMVGDDMNRLRLGGNIGIDAASAYFHDLAMAGESLSLNSITYEYEDLGYYSRMIDFCAGEMDMSREAYVEHHLDAWQARWMKEGMVAGPELIEVYERFIQDPGTLSGRIVPTGNVLELLERGVEPSRMLGQVSITLSLNGAAIGPLDLRYATRDEQQAGTRRTRSTPRAGTSAGGTRGTVPEPPEWKAVSPSSLDQFEGAQVRVVLRDGRERSGRLEAVQRERIILQRRMSGGYMSVPISRSEIADVAVWQ